MDEAGMSSQTKPLSRRWYRYLRFSMRGLIVVVLLFGGWLGWVVRGERIQREAVRAITIAGGTVQYEWEWKNGNLIPGGKSWVPEPLVDLIGVDYFGHVTSVWLSGSPEVDTALGSIVRLPRLERLVLTGSSVSDAGVAHLKGLTNLVVLDLNYTRITDAGMAHLEGLDGLSVLCLNGTKITDAGLAHLEGLRSLTELSVASTRVSNAGLAHLKGLRKLSILVVVTTKVTDAGMNELKQARPRLTVYR
jgi:hypothetical protein